MDVLERPKRKSKVFNEIQATLHVYFPKTRFEMNAYNNNDYKVIEISYTDGASLTRVKNAINPFRCPSNPGINFQGVKIKVNRNMSVGTKKQLLGELKSVFNLKIIPNEKDWVDTVNSTAGDYINKIFKMRDFN